MKRSEGKNIQTKAVGFNLAKQGIKTCTSRYGDRLKEYNIGEIYNFVNNYTDEILKIKIIKQELKTLNNVTESESIAIQNYSWAEMVWDVYDIYHNNLGREVNKSTVFTLVWFEVVDDEDEMST